MYETLDLFRTSAALARHAGTRQAVAAINVANADTPGFRAQMLPDFADTYQGAMRSTRPGHLGGSPDGVSDGVSGASSASQDAGGEAAPNGNTVSLEAEMFASAQASREHGRALAVWRHAATVLRATLGG